MEGFDFNIAPMNAQPSAPQQSGRSAGGGGWHWLLTLVSLVIVGGLSFLMAFLTKDVANRPVWLMGLIFVVPMAAMFFVNLLIEHLTEAMTPAYVRKRQLLVALLAVVGTFAIGSVCDLVYLTQYSGGNSSADTVFVLDKSGSMSWHGDNEKMVEAVEGCLDQMSPNANVGMVLFTDVIYRVVDIAPLKQAGHREALEEALTLPTTGGTNLAKPITEALNKIEGLSSRRGVQIILLTDGDPDDFQTYNDSVLAEHTARCRDLKVTVSIVNLGDTAEIGGVANLATATNGEVVQVDDTETLLNTFAAFTFRDGDMLRVNETMANVMTGVMFLLEGVVIGLGLWLMLSVSGQFRVQVIISPVLGIAAFVLLKFLGFHSGMSCWWILEGFAFSLLGLVFKVRNRASAQPAARPAAPAQAQGDSFGSFGDSGFGSTQDGF